MMSAVLDDRICHGMIYCSDRMGLSVRQSEADHISHREILVASEPVYNSTEAAGIRGVQTFLSYYKTSSARAMSRKSRF
jgi:hypothetical protein